MQRCALGGRLFDGWFLQVAQQQKLFLLSQKFHPSIHCHRTSNCVWLTERSCWRLIWESTSVMSSLSTPTSLLSQSEADITFDLKPPVSVNSSQFFFLCYWMRLFGAYCEMFKIPQHQCHHRCKYVLMTDLILDLILLWLLSCRCVFRHEKYRYMLMLKFSKTSSCSH